MDLLVELSQSCVSPYSIFSGMEKQELMKWEERTSNFSSRILPRFSLMWFFFFLSEKNPITLLVQLSYLRPFCFILKNSCHPVGLAPGRCISVTETFFSFVSSWYHMQFSASLHSPSHAPRLMWKFLKWLKHCFSQVEGQT